MAVLTGASLVLPDRVLSPGSLALERGWIASIDERTFSSAPGAGVIDLRDHYVVPGFIDAHVHGTSGHDTLDGAEAVVRIAAALPRYGVVGFAPTSVACPPDVLRRFLEAVGVARRHPAGRAARVLPAHLESNFINPAYAGAQPAACLRRPPRATPGGWTDDARHDDFGGADVLREIEAHRADVGVVTLAPELPGGLALIRHLAGLGVQVSLGHSAAGYEEAEAAFAAGARRVTHLFNRMAPLHHRNPGLAGAALNREGVSAEIIADGYHVHPAMIRMSIAARQASHVLAITDGTAGSGLAAGARAWLGGRAITVGEHAAHLEDGTLAGSTATMDAVFRTLVSVVGVSLPVAARLCATTPARELGLHDHGAICVGAAADLVVLDRHLRVVQTWLGGDLVYARSAGSRKA